MSDSMQAIPITSSCQTQKGISTAAMLTIVVIALIAIAVLAYYLLGDEKVEPQAITQTPAPIENSTLPVPLPPPSPDIAEQYQLTGELPSLDQSDAFVRGHLMFLAGEPLLTLLQGDNLAQKFVLQVHNIAEGKLVYQHSPIKAPSTKGLQIKKNPSGNEIDPASYSRYDFYADLFSGIDTRIMIAIYGYYEPLLDKAYAELGHPAGSFRPTFLKAMDVVLSAPVIESPIAVVMPNLNWEFEDSSLQKLNMVQKQMIRMGPDNTKKIQAAIADFKQALMTP